MAREARLTHGTLFQLRDAHHARDVVLLEDGQPRAVHGGERQALEELPCENFRAAAVHYGLVEHLHESEAGIVYFMALVHRDELRLVPRQLAERADHAFEGALEAFARKGRLGGEGGMSVGTHLERGGMEKRGRKEGGERERETYSMRALDMLDQHGHLLSRNKALEPIPRLLHTWLLEDGHRAHPDNATRLQEEGSHKHRLAG